MTDKTSRPTLLLANFHKQHPKLACGHRQYDKRLWCTGWITNDTFTSERRIQHVL